MRGSATQKVTYDSTHRYAVDPNRRVQMPLAWRPAKPIEFTMIVWPQGPCLRVLPPEEMEKLRAQVANLPTTPEKTLLKRHIGSASARVSLDSAKRLAIPAEMAEEVGIRDEALFAGVLDYFEIWPPDRYKETKTLQKSDLSRAIQLLE
ncbi:MAG: division/cell wall cluster transcriptional repressor MraZ [Verrucomicrobiota bacterium]|jgi:division/cell wall cluster transcriptional repressor MraZ